MAPTWFTLPWGLHVHAYGTLILIGGLITIPGIYWDLGQRGILGPRRAHFVLDFYIAICVAALVGGRVAHVLTFPGEFFANPTRIFASEGTGFVFFGSFAAIVLSYVWLARRHGITFASLCDLSATWIPLGHAFGRLGCFFAGCCWGAPTHASWGLPFPESSVVWQLAPGLRHGPQTFPLHPVQAYEATGLLVLFIWLLATRLRRGVEQPFAQLGRYALGYGLLRSVTELFRGDVSRGLVWPITWPALSRVLELPEHHMIALSQGQLVALILMTIGAFCAFTARPAVRLGANSREAGA